MNLTSLFGQQQQLQKLRIQVKQFTKPSIKAVIKGIKSIKKLKTLYFDSTLPRETDLSKYIITEVAGLKVPECFLRLNDLWVDHEVVQTFLKNLQMVDSQKKKVYLVCGTGFDKLEFKEVCRQNLQGRLFDGNFILFTLDKGEMMFNRFEMKKCIDYEF